MRTINVVRRENGSTSVIVDGQRCDHEHDSACAWMWPMPVGGTCEHPCCQGTHEHADGTQACPRDEDEDVCADCGMTGERTGHMGCFYPQDRN